MARGSIDPSIRLTGPARARASALPGLDPHRGRLLNSIATGSTPHGRGGLLLLTCPAEIAVHRGKQLARLSS
jgi:hypothetical protein